MAGRFSVDLKDHVALVTGAGDAVGRAVALALARAGAAVCAVGTNPDRLDRVVESIQTEGGRGMAWTGDVSNRFQVVAMIEAVREQFGGLHLLVNAAGVEKRAPLLSLDEYDWRRVLEINLTGTFFCTQLAARVMTAEGDGVIVNVIGASGESLAGYDNAASRTSRSAVLAFTRESARALAAEGVRVNAIWYANITPESEALDRIPQGRTGTPEEIAAAVLFLCSEGASFMAGHTLVIDGGAHTVG